MDNQDFEVQEFIPEGAFPMEEKPDIFISTEINLAKWPQLFATSENTAKSREIIRGDSKVTIGKQELKHGKKVEIVQVGILRVPDYIVLNGLIRLWEIQGEDRNQEHMIEGHASEFIRTILDRPMIGGKQRAQLEDCLKRLVNIPINWEKAFYDSKTGQLESIVDYKFRFLQELKIWKLRLPGKKLELKRFRFRFNQSFLNNLLDGKTKPTNFSELRRLNSEIAVLAYPFLDLVMAKRTEWSRRATSFISQDLHIEAERYKKPSNCRDALQRVMKELNGCKLSNGTLRLSLVRTNDGKDYRLNAHRQPFARAKHVGIMKSSAQDPIEVAHLVEQLIVTLGRQKNKGFYYLLAYKCPRDLINTALRDTIDAYNAGQINTSKAAYFGWLIKDIAKARGIDLGLKSSSIVRKDGAA